VEDEQECSWSSEVVLESVYEVPPEPVIEIVGDELVVEPAGFEVQWYLGEDLIAGANSASIPYEPVTYTVSLANPGGFCEVFSAPFLVLDVLSESRTMVYPNPTNGFFAVQLPKSLGSQAVRVTVWDVAGRQVLQSNKLQINQRLPSGTYLVVIESEGIRLAERLIVK